jgi:hypothetical protein
MQVTENITTKQSQSNVRVLFNEFRLKFPPRALPGSSSSKRMIDNQQNHRAKNCYEEAVEIEPANPGGSKGVEQPAPNNGADNSQQDVEHDALTSPIYDLAANKPCNQTENDPSQK